MSSARFTLSSRAALPMRRILSGNATFSAIVMWGNSA